jgi:ubiquinone/menaquinone biosynthesis C-methylase UbiE
MTNFIENIFKEKFNTKEGVYECVNIEKENDEIKKADIETYNFKAKKFNESEMVKLSKRHVKSIGPILDSPKNSVILELGGGDGRFGIYLLKQGFRRVIESDISYGSVKRAEEVARKNNINEGNFCVIDSENLPFKDSTLDIVFMVASLHHIPNPKKAVKEINKALKPGGSLIILKEPAAWQYYFFFPFFKLVRKFVRKDKKIPISLADDETFGFTKRKINKMLNPYFDEVVMTPVHYLEKIYTNLVILINKVAKKNLKQNKLIVSLLRKTDRVIARVPILRNLTWDWDIYAFSNKK